MTKIYLRWVNKKILVYLTSIKQKIRVRLNKQCPQHTHIVIRKYKQTIKNKIKWRIFWSKQGFVKRNLTKYIKQYVRWIRRTNVYYNIVIQWYIKPRNIDEDKIFSNSDLLYLYKLNWVNLFEWNIKN